MGKHTSPMILPVIFALLFVVVFGSNSGNTLEIAEKEEQNPGQGQSQECSQQLQQQQQLDACQRYLVQSSQPISLSINGEEEEENSWREEFMRCCPQLEQVEEKCRCEGIKRIVEREEQRGELKGEQMQEMLLTAQTLPALCGRMAPGRCDFPTLLLRPPTHIGGTFSLEI